MTTFGKVAIGTSVLGTLGGGAVLANNLLSKPEEKLAPKLQTISEKLTEEGFDTSVGNQWQTILDAYNKVTDSDKIFSASKLKKEDLAGLQGDCTRLLGRNSISDKDYKKVKQWCVKPETVEAILKKGKYDLLNTEDSNKERDSDWEQITLRLANSKSSFPGVGDKMQGKKEDDVKALKAGCEALKVKVLKTIDDGFNEKFEQARSWCAIKKE